MLKTDHSDKRMHYMRSGGGIVYILFKYESGTVALHGQSRTHHIAKCER